ncbi:glycosyltransferase [Saccharomonospora xinjiangensis]|uniref:glycosyltransferase family 2 protein n=1 Tax=Saccharomonospora xinjiangensis TaxID=75294 RepID=UPI00106FDA59|nr:glycosyltransferase [Saccharomonospora xinjiangensis]QBQ59604.1 N-acetylglucosaminyl-diphospho-decaprenol L-rhamnosyltransferase [Saccharomonospora xinjiangensis]
MRTSVVIATRDRARDLANTLTRLRALNPVPPIIVVDNGSTDDTADRVRADFPGVRLIRLPENVGMAARNLGVEAADTPYVAFSDDDSWWAQGSLTRAEVLFDAYPRVGLVAATTLVGPECRRDPVCDEMAGSPLGTAPDLPGPRVLGFLACSAVVRRSAFLDAGGFNPLLHFGAEEKLLAYDLAARGWELCYVDRLRAHHHPSANRPSVSWRRRIERRNNVLITWMRRPAGDCARTAGLLLRDPLAAAGALRRLPGALGARRRLPDHVERQIRELA